jgi:hypothetical protein
MYPAVGAGCGLVGEEVTHGAEGEYASVDVAKDAPEGLADVSVWETRRSVNVFVKDGFDD